MTPATFFHRTEQVERTAAAIYEALAQAFAAEPRVAARLRELADEELQHAARIRLFRAQHGASLPPFGRPRLEEELADMERYAAGLLDEARRGALGDDIAAVHPRLAEMEERLALHAEAMARGSEGTVRGFFEALARQDRAHQRLFRE